MNRNRHMGGRDRGGHSYGGGDGLLGEGPGMGGGGGLFEPMVNSQINQLMIAQHLLQQQAALGSFGGGGGDCGLGNYGGIGSLGGGAMGNMHYHQQQGMGYSGMGGMRNDRKRVGGQGRDMDFKRRRHNSAGRGGDRDRSRGRDSNRSSEGRDIIRSSRDSDKEQDKKQSGKARDTDSTAPTDEEGKDKEKEGSLYCHVCSVSVYDEDSFRRHLNGSKHAQRMNSLLTVHQIKSDQLKSRLQAEEHLRKIEGKNGGVDPEYFCKICNNSLTIPWERHRFSNIHKQRQLQVKRGCGWCNVHDFTNFTEVLRHRETDEHRKNAELNGKKRTDSDGSRSRSGSRERRSEKDDDNEDLTIPEFNPENPVGISYIIPVTGYFCKLCHKFYNSEKSAKGSHCQSEAHYDKFKQATEAKQEAREKRLAEEAAAAAAAKEKAEEEKEKKEKDGDMEEGEKAEKNGDNQEYSEDYDDDLPVEDEDNDGGLLDDDMAGLVRDTTSDSILNDTSANSSFVFLSGDKAQAHVDLQRREQGLLQKSATSEEQLLSTQKGKAFTKDSRNVADDANMNISGEDDDKDDDILAASGSDDDTTTAKSPAKTKGGGTAKKVGARERLGNEN